VSWLGLKSRGDEEAVVFWEGVALFNLLVAYSGWNGHRDTVKRQRLLEYTDGSIALRFKPSGALDIDAVAALPCLFMPEIGSDVEQVARVGRLIKIRELGAEIQLDYAYDQTIPPVPSAKIEALSTVLDIAGYELSRTHWAIKDVDLFEALLRAGVEQPFRPTVFNLSTEPVDSSLISVMMPFSAGFDEVYSALSNALASIQKRCQRADDMWKHDAIIADIVYLICTSRAVICDLSGKNANVFYETGIAHTLGKDVILITQSMDDVPFNLRHLRHIKYDNNPPGRVELAKQVRARLESLAAIA
jgi:hypothetical protein